MKFKPFSSDQFKIVCTKIDTSADIRKGWISLSTITYISSRGISILGEVRNVEISRVTQQFLFSKSHNFLAVFALAHSKINQIALW